MAAVIFYIKISFGKTINSDGINEVSSIQCIELIHYVEEDPKVLFAGMDMDDFVLESSHPLETIQPENEMPIELTRAHRCTHLAVGF